MNIVPDCTTRFGAGQAKISSPTAHVHAHARYRLRTEEAYVDWSRQFILFHAHQREEGEILSDNFLYLEGTIPLAGMISFKL